MTTRDGLNSDNNTLLAGDALSNDELLSIMTALDDDAASFNGLTALEEIRSSLTMESSLARYNQVHGRSQEVINNSNNANNIVAQNTRNLSRLVNDNLGVQNTSIRTRLVVNGSHTDNSRNNSRNNTNISRFVGGSSGSGIGGSDSNSGDGVSLNRVNDTPANRSNFTRDMTYLQYLTDTINEGSRYNFNNIANGVINRLSNGEHDVSTELVDNGYENTSDDDDIDDWNDIIYDSNIDSVTLANNMRASIDDTYEFEDVIVGLDGPISKYGTFHTFLTSRNANNVVVDIVVCRICCPVSPDEDLEEIKADKWYSLLCGHNICDTCAEHWFSKSKKCPFCRCDLQDMLEDII